MQMTLRQLYKSYPGFIMGIGAIFICRLVIVFSMGLMPQDAYYYYYTRHLALSYFDHPPMIAYLLYVYTSIFGNGVAAIKFADFSTTLVSIFLFYKLSRRLLSHHRAMLATVLLFSTLMVTILSMVSTPDVPLILFWTLALIYVHKALTDGLKRDWILSGVIIGFAFDSKYTAVFLLAGLFIFLLFTIHYRHYLFSRRSLLLIVGFLCAVSPVFIWNFANDWGSFGFQGSSRFSNIMALRLQPELTIGLIGHQLLILIPVLGLCTIYLLSRKARRLITGRRISDQNRFLIAFSVPMLLFFGLLSPIYWIKLNWLMPAYIAGVILAAQYIRLKYVKWQMAVAVIFHLVLIVQILWYPVNIKSDDTWWGWEEFSEEVKKRVDEYPDCFLFSMDGYKTSAILSYYLEDKMVFSSNVIQENGLQFSVEHPCLDEYHGKNALFLDSEKRDLSEKGHKPPDPRLADFFNQIVELDPILIRDKKENILRKYYVYRCIDYQPGCIEQD
ncbi:MAG: glycosyltransferase family 39 protein [Saprospiraceae bacterium]|nr:glycosyltransferase family 39 protein [Saprospiraceae bacterium]